jgi:predicted ester cyclase
MADAKEFSRRQIDLFNQGQIDEGMKGWADDAELVTPMSGPLKGREAIAAYWRQMRETFPDAKVTVHRMVAEGDTVVTEYTFPGTNTGPLRLPTGETVPATNRVVTGPALDIGTIVNGKVISLHQYFDMVPGMVQLGLMPAPAGAPA